MPRITWRPIITSLIAVALFSAAAWVLHSELRDLQLEDLAQALADLPRGAVLLAATLAVFNYGFMVCYDGLALRQLGRDLGFTRTALAAFVGYAYSNNLGFQVVSGTTVRYRLYSRWGLGGNELARLVVFNLVAVNLGIVTLLGTAFVLDPSAWLLGFSPAGMWDVVGGILLLVPLLYLLACARIRGQLRVGGYELDLPRPVLGTGQIVTGTLDWLMATTILWILLPEGEIAFTTLLAAFMAAQVVGLVSQVPGGLGVFEGSMLLLLGSEVPRETLLSALLFFRLVYYVLPLVVATALLLTDTLPRRRFAGRLGDFTGWILPRALAGLLFASGVLVLGAAAAPVEPARYEWLLLAAPPAVIAVAHWLSIVCGVALLLIAPMLLWRLSRAWRLSLAVLTVAALAVLLGGLRLELAGFIAVVLALAAGSRPQFRATGSLQGSPLPLGWTSAAVAVVAAGSWVGWVAFPAEPAWQDVLSFQLWVAVGPDAHPERLVQAGVGAMVCLAVGLALRALGRSEPFSEPLTGAPAQEVVANLGELRSSALPRLQLEAAQLSLRYQDKLLLYTPCGRSWIAIGEPLGPDAATELIPHFVDRAFAAGRQPVVAGITRRTLPVCGDLGLAFLHFGDAARVAVDRADNPAYRADAERLLQPVDAIGGRSRVVDPYGPGYAELIARLAEQGWPVDVPDDAPVAVLEGREGVLGVLTALPSRGRRYELIIRDLKLVDAAFASAREALAATLVLWAHRQGYRWLHLGIARAEEHEQTDRAERVRVSRNRDVLLDPDPDREWRAVLQPRWEPRFLAYPGGLALPRTFRDLRQLSRAHKLRLR